MRLKTSSGPALLGKSLFTSEIRTHKVMHNAEQSNMSAAEGQCMGEKTSLNAKHTKKH